MNRQARGYLMALTAGLLCGTNGPLMRAAEYHAVGTGLARAIGAGLVLLLLGRTIRWTRPTVSAGLLFFGGNVCYIVAVLFSSAAEAAALTYVYPGILLLAAAVQGRRPSCGGLLSVVGASAGVLIMLGNGLANGTGGAMLLAIGAGSMFAVFISICSKSSRQERDGAILLSQLIGAACFAAIVPSVHMPAPDLHQLVCLALLGIFSGLPFWLIGASTGEIEGYKLGVCLMLEVPAATSIAWLALGESVSAVQGLGMLLVVGSALYLVWSDREPRGQ